VTPESVRDWARYSADSPLYTHLVEVIASDPELMKVIDRVVHLPAPNMLFGAVQFLLAAEPGAKLAAYYPSFTDDPLPLEGVDGPFRDFVLAHAEEIVEIGATRYTQTNECRRCVALLPAVWEAPFDRFHMIDIGTSAGLNLALDRYRYQWDGVAWGPESSVVLVAESRGVDPLPREIDLLSRVGLDLNPIDIDDPVERLWLESLVWPEHHQRRERLRLALGLAAQVPIEMVGGDAVEVLPGVLERLPDGDPVVMTDSFSLNQFDPGQIDRLDRVVATERRRRPVHRVSWEPVANRGDSSPIMVDDGDGWWEKGWGHHHGEWVELYARP
jgi:hypothetical protein